MNRTSPFLQILLLNMVTLCSVMSQEDSFRTFTNKDGKQIKATIVDVHGEEVTIERKDGKRFKFPIASLSDADQDYIKKWKKPIGKLEFEIKCTKKPAAVPKDIASRPPQGGKSRTKGYCYEVTITNKSFQAMPELDIHYTLYKGTSGNTRNGTSVQEAGKGEFKLPAVARLKSATNLTDAIAVSQSTSSTATLNGDGTYDKSYTKTRESLAGVKLVLYADGRMIKEYSHGRIGE